MSRGVSKTDLSFDITNATREEIEAISQQVVKNLAERASLSIGRDLVSSHDRHYSTHSSDASSINPADFDRFRDFLLGGTIRRG